MATYKLSDLFNRICEIGNDGYDYANIIELDGDPEDDMPVSLSLSAIDEFEEIHYDDVDSVNISDDNFDGVTHSINPNDYSYKINFTYREVSIINQCVNNALEYYKECLNNSSYSRDDKDSIKEASINARNLQAKLAHFAKLNL